ncbi:unnamed protein product [Caenorhabditis auriculariae]|uniref:Transmembrane protein n=1 Tax=Caenorhabditis auriculariae TaxID=2777116 RepID=A0A8S1GWM1_9PELO|nr:unnamed protein product [Caenorhabditis auriculariae]
MFRFILLAAFYSIFFVLSSFALEQKWSFDSGELPSNVVDDLPVLHTAFVQTGEELHYLSTTVRPDSHKTFNEGDAKIIKRHIKKLKDKNYNVKKLAGTGELPLEFDPPFLSFGESHVGRASKQRVFVRNVLKESVLVDAIIANSLEFHVTFFDKIKLAPQGTASFEVVFLPREVGLRKTTFLVYTSSAVFTLEAAGNCVSNPYRIPPFTGLRVPLNGSAVKPFFIHNPHPHTLRLTEITSSGGNAHVELPHFVDEKFAGELPQYWDIRSYQTKKVANILIVGGNEENSTLFFKASAILLEGNKKKIIEDIVYAIPVEISSTRGVFATSDLLDFGLLRHGDRSNPQTFSVYQYLMRGRLEFETLYVEKGDHTGIYMEFSSPPPIPVLPGKHITQPGEPSDLVKVFFDASRVDFPDKKPGLRHFSGHIIAVSRGGNYNVTMPFRASVFQGGILTVGNDLALQESLRPPHQRTVRLRNDLPFDVVVWNISMSSDAQNYFSVRLLAPSVKLEKGAIMPVFVLKYNKRVPDSFDNAVFYVYTNVSTFRVVMNKFSGKMNIQLASVDKQSFNFGYVERNDTRTIRFTVWNENKAEMHLRKLSVPSRQAYRLYMVGIQKKGINSNDVDDLERTEHARATDADIPPESGAVFDLELKVPIDGTVYDGNLLFETEYESKLFSVTYEVSSGTLQSIPDHVSFGQTFPAKLVYRTLQVFNSFAEDMVVTRLTTLSQDPRFFFESFDPSQPPLLRSGRLTNLGRVMFSPQLPCVHENCYLGLPLKSPDGQWFVHGLTLPANLAEIDAYLYKRQRSKYDALVKAGKHRVNTTIILDTDKAKNIKIKTSAELTWPRLLTRNSIHFPLTALGNFTIVNLTLNNPTSLPIVVQVIPLVIYPDAETLVDLFRPHLLTPLSEHVEMNETLMFSLRDTELFTLKRDSPVPKLREELESAIPQNVPRFTLSLMLKPHMKVRLRLGFLPSDYTLRSSLLLIRNNLTVIEPVVMYGKGARIGMKVEGVEARSKQPLLFEIRQDHLSDCNNPKRLMHKLHSTLTVRRPFAVVNTGEVHFTVTNMSINGVPCENRGFRILNCYPFRLQPNESYSLDIAYTPDFLTTTNEADLQLYMHMNGSAWLFPLAATVPADMLAKCHQALPRPPFENIMYYSCVTALIFCLVCVLACAYLEGDRAIACGIRQQYAAPRTVFDLKNLNMKAHETVKTPKMEWKGNTPSELKVSDDAWLVSRFLIRVANWVVQLVHSVWKWSLFYRGEKSEPKSAGKKRKKNLTPVVTSKIETTLSSEEEREYSKREEITANVTAAVAPSGKPKAPEVSAAPSKKARQQLRASKSPKSATYKEEPKKSEDRLNNTTTSNVASQNKPQPNHQPVEGQPKNEKQNRPLKGEVNAKNKSKQAKRGSTAKIEVPAPKTTTTVKNAAADWVEQNNFAEDLTPVAGSTSFVWSSDKYEDQSECPSLPQTPTPSLASSLVKMDNEWSADGRKQDLVNDDSESLMSEGSAPPDWIDEPVFFPDDVDAELIALAEATTDMLLSNSEDEGDFSPMNSFSSSQKSNRPRGIAKSEESHVEPVKLDARRKTVGSEKSERNAELRKKSSGQPVEPPSQPEVLPFWPMLPNVALSSMLDGDQELLAHQRSMAMWPTPISDPSLSMSHGAQSTLDNPLYQNLGMSLGPSVAAPTPPTTTFGNTLFAGPDFNLWSNIQFDPTTAWANLRAPNQSTNEEESKK